MATPVKDLIALLAVIALGAAPLSACGDEPDPADGDADADVDGDADIDGYADDDAEEEPVDRRFPEGFLFGSATAGFQVEMGCPTLPPEQCEDRSSDWYEFITSPVTLGSEQTYLTGDPPTAGPGHWELYETDIDLAASELQNNAIRISIEWSRIFPEPTDEAETAEEVAALADTDAVAHYHDVLGAMREAGLTPLVTLNHYSLPSWIHDAVGCHQNLNTCERRGWVDRERTVREIAKYAAFVASEFGGEIDLWATLNEPFAVLFPGYVMPTEDRTNPPATLLRAAEARTVFVALIEAHARMYDAVVANDLEDADEDGEAASVGIVYAMAPVRPADPDDPLDVQAAENVFYLWNMAFLNAVALGELDDDLDGVAETRDDLVDRMDYIGINYYTRVTVSGAREAMLPDLSPLTTFDPFGIEPWEDYSRGIYEMALIVRDQLELPVIITENGSEDPEAAPSWIVRHLRWVHQAIEDGVDLQGYFYWTLMDNYEWNHGMDIRMGLYAVDPEDEAKARVARDAVEVYGEIAGSGLLSAELISAYPGS